MYEAYEHETMIEIYIVVKIDNRKIMLASPQQNKQIFQNYKSIHRTRTDYEIYPYHFDKIFSDNKPFIN